MNRGLALAILLAACGDNGKTCPGPFPDGDSTGHADPLGAGPNEARRWRGQIPIQTRAVGGFVIIAAYGDHDLEPVHRGRTPFGVTNPIFLEGKI